ncbi:MAG: hypothetical protein GY829_05225 [Gammaproteobacteria bacterium]|nr:hypothetical protein [Gammaproteobacteria bacterium]
MENKDVFNITWQNIDIEITCNEPDYLKSYREFYGHKMLHIEVRSQRPENAPLPITDTGYKSIFIAEPDLARQGGSLKYVTSYIDTEAKNKKWKNYQECSRQFNLF